MKIQVKQINNKKIIVLPDSFPETEWVSIRSIKNPKKLNINSSQRIPVKYIKSKELILKLLTIRGTYREDLIKSLNSQGISTPTIKIILSRMKMTNTIKSKQIGKRAYYELV